MFCCKSERSARYLANIIPSAVAASGMKLAYAKLVQRALEALFES
jgi:hypothetical protein